MFRWLAVAVSVRAVSGCDFTTTSEEHATLDFGCPKFGLEVEDTSNISKGVEHVGSLAAVRATTRRRVNSQSSTTSPIRPVTSTSRERRRQDRTASESSTPVMADRPLAQRLSHLEAWTRRLPLLPSLEQCPPSTRRIPRPRTFATIAIPGSIMLRASSICGNASRSHHETTDDSTKYATSTGTCRDRAIAFEFNSAFELANPLEVPVCFAG